MIQPSCETKKPIPVKTTNFEVNKVIETTKQKVIKAIQEALTQSFGDQTISQDYVNFNTSIAILPSLEEIVFS